MNRAMYFNSDDVPGASSRKKTRVFKAFFMAAFVSCWASSTAATSQGNARSSLVKIKIGLTTFTATLEEHPAAQAFRAQLPITLKMADLNANEKFFDLPTALPSRPSTPHTVQSGDLMLYGSRTLVLFYKAFTTTYSYTRLGRVDDPKGLAAALGRGNVTLTFEPR